MTVAFSNGGNRDAALLRVEPALWSQRTGKKAAWAPLDTKVAKDVPLTDPKVPLIIRAGGVVRDWVAYWGPALEGAGTLRYRRPSPDPRSCRGWREQPARQRRASVGVG